MAKTMCKWSKKDIKDDMADLIEIVRKPRFVCTKCGRVAANKKQLCKPHDMSAKT